MLLSFAPNFYSLAIRFSGAGGQTRRLNGKPVKSRYCPRNGKRVVIASATGSNSPGRRNRLIPVSPDTGLIVFCFFNFARVVQKDIQ